MRMIIARIVIGVFNLFHEITVAGGANGFWDLKTWGIGFSIRECEYGGGIREGIACVYRVLG